MSEFGAGLAQGTGPTFGPSLAQAMHNARLAKQRQEEMEYRRATENTRMAERALDRRERKDIRAEERERADRKTATEEARYQSGLLREDRDFKAAQANAALADVRRLEDRQIAEDRATDAEQRLLREEAERTRRFKLARADRETDLDREKANIATARADRSNEAIDKRLWAMQGGLDELSQSLGAGRAQFQQAIMESYLRARAMGQQNVDALRSKLVEAQLGGFPVDPDRAADVFGEAGEGILQLLEAANASQDPVAVAEAKALGGQLDAAGGMIRDALVEVDPDAKRAKMADAGREMSRLAKMVGERTTVLDRVSGRLMKPAQAPDVDPTEIVTARKKLEGITVEPGTPEYRQAALDNGVPSDVFVLAERSVKRGDYPNLVEAINTGPAGRGAGYVVSDPLTNAIVPLPQPDAFHKDTLSTLLKKSVAPGLSVTPGTIHRLYRDEGVEDKEGGREFIERLVDAGLLGSGKPLTTAALKHAIQAYIGRL